MVVLGLAGDPFPGVSFSVVPCLCTKTSKQGKIHKLFALRSFGTLTKWSTTELNSMASLIYMKSSIATDMLWHHF